MAPAGLLPGENEVIRLAPEELLASNDGMENAAWAGLGTEDLARNAGSHIENANGPRLSFTLRPEGEAAAARGNASVGETRAVGRPNGIGVVIDGAIGIAERFVCGRIESD